MNRAIKTMLVGLLLVSSQAMAVVTHNVTFTVKSNGTVQASTNMGTFDSSGTVLTVSGTQLPAEFRRGYEDSVTNPVDDSFSLVSQVGYSMSSQSGDGSQLNMSFRLKAFQALSSGSNAAGTTVATCDGGSYITGGRYKMSTDGKNFNYTGCKTKSARGGGGGKFYFDNIIFAFMEDIGGMKSLSNLKLPAGTYKLSPGLFRIRHLIATKFDETQEWLVNITVVVEPSIAAVDMPASLPLDVSKATPSQLVGKGALTATVTGTLGKYLRIEPRSTNNGKLLNGGQQIPYTLTVTPLSGDNQPRLLIDGTRSGAQPPVNIETFVTRELYRLRFDVAFATATTGLSSGNFTDSVTLIFTTPDIL